MDKIRIEIKGLKISSMSTDESTEETYLSIDHISLDEKLEGVSSDDKAKEMISKLLNQIIEKLN